MAVRQFPSTYTWPLPMKERYEQVLRYPGIHYTFQAGRRFGEEIKGLLLPFPRYVGWTMRFFIFAGAKEGGTYGCHYSGLSRHFKKFTLSAIRVTLTGGDVRLRSVDNSPDPKEAVTDIKGSVTEGDVYTVSIAVVGKETFEAYFNYTHLGRVTMYRDITKHLFKLWVKNHQHTTLSMHFSWESGDVDFFGTHLHVKGLTFPVGTYVVHTSEYDGQGDVEVFIGDKSGAPTRVYSSAVTLESWEKFTCTVQMGVSSFIFSLSFEPKPEVFVPNEKLQRWNRLEVTFSANVRQKQSHYSSPY